MIVADMISFIEHDLTTFGVGILGFLLAALVFFFPGGTLGAVAHVLLPDFRHRDDGLSGVHGLEGDGDFLKLCFAALLIITMSLTIHLIVRYRILNEVRYRILKRKLRRWTRKRWSFTR